MAEKLRHLSREEAEGVAIGGLAFLAGDPEALGRFLAIVGIGPEMLRKAAAEPGFLGGVVDYFLGNESLLIAYAQHAGIPPEHIGMARQALGT
jgi:hypothetical protein